MTILQGFKLWGRHLRVKTWQKDCYCPAFSNDGILIAMALYMCPVLRPGTLPIFLLNDLGVRCLKFFVSFSELLEKKYFSKVVTKVLICGTSALLEGLRKPRG